MIFITLPNLLIFKYLFLSNAIFSLLLKSLINIIISNIYQKFYKLIFKEIRPTIFYKYKVIINSKKKVKIVKVLNY